MPHRKGRKEATRQRILQAAARLFATRGFAGTSIAAVMNECDLTSGGFYAHFKSKAQLYKEAICGVCATPALSITTDDRVEPGESNRLIDKLDFAFLATDVNSAAPEVRQAYALALESLQRQLDRNNPYGSTGDYSTALAAAAVLIGARAVHASVDDQAIQRSMADACRSALQKIMKPERPTYFWSLEDKPASPALPT